MEKWDNGEQIDRFIQQEITNKTFPGAVLGIVNDKEILYRKSFGYAQLVPKKYEMRENMLFDLASLTKVVATTTAIMQLIENGNLELDSCIKQYYPGIDDEKKTISVLHLLTHTSGFPAMIRLWDKDLGYGEKMNRVLNNPLEAEVGKKVIYSDLNFILLGDLIRRVTGQRIDEYTGRNIFHPLKMMMTVFNPLESLPHLGKEDFAATEMCQWRNRVLIGEVHDENAWSFNGVSGHAGLFSNIDDLCIFLQMLLNKGIYEGVRVLSHNTIRSMIKDWTPNLNYHRGLGWDLIKNIGSPGGELFSDESFGHSGFTGTSIWIDPKKKLGVVFLTNRVHLYRRNMKIIAFRPRLHHYIASLFPNF